MRLFPHLLALHLLTMRFANGDELIVLDQGYLLAGSWICSVCKTMLLFLGLCDLSFYVFFYFYFSGISVQGSNLL